MQGAEAGPFISPSHIPVLLALQEANAFSLINNDGSSSNSKSEKKGLYVMLGVLGVLYA